MPTKTTPRSKAREPTRRAKQLLAADVENLREKERLATKAGRLATKAALPPPHPTVPRGRPGEPWMKPYVLTLVEHFRSHGASWHRAINWVYQALVLDGHGGGDVVTYQKVTHMVRRARAQNPAFGAPAAPCRIRPSHDPRSGVIRILPCRAGPCFDGVRRSSSPKAGRATTVLDEDQAVARIERIYADGLQAASRTPIKVHWDTVVLQLAMLRELRAIREVLDRDDASVAGRVRV